MTILEALKARRTIRLFKQAAVSSDDLRDMLDAARQTSCACN
jgi:nitroreductase